jgi:hypothetical protein
MKPYLTVEDYRMRYPNTASIPTITQRGLLGGVLMRHEHRMARRAHRRAVIGWVLELPFRAVASVWRALAPAPAVVASRA